MIAYILALLVAGASAQVDLATQPGAAGPAVVEATLNRLQASCLFDDDKLLLRRLAYLLTNDGQDPATYRSGYHGGIWNVEERWLQWLQDSTHDLSKISALLGVAVQNMTWEDLRKPLHSAVIALLYINDMGTRPIPRDPAAQAAIWREFYDNTARTEQYVAAATLLDQGCMTGNEVDLIFVVDASGSIGMENFTRMRTFIKDVIQDFMIGPNATRVGLVLFASPARIEFNLTQHTNKQALLDAVDALPYLSGGTSTYLALQILTRQAFSAAYGARENVPKVGIVLTDGSSGEPEWTARSAEEAHNASITLFAVGVGNETNDSELRAIASNPDCQHTFYLDGFKEFTAFKTAITRKTCQAPLRLTAPLLDSQSTSVTFSMMAQQGRNLLVDIPLTNGLTISVSVVISTVHIYIATLTFASPAHYDYHLMATPNSDGVIFLTREMVGAAFVYCSIVADEEVDVTFNITNGDINPCASNPCNGNLHQCFNNGKSYKCVCNGGYRGAYCEIAPTVYDTLTSSKMPILVPSGEQYVYFIILVPPQGATFLPQTRNSTMYISTNGYPSQNSYETVYFIRDQSSPIFLQGNPSTAVWYYVMVHVRDITSGLLGTVHREIPTMLVPFPSSGNINHVNVTSAGTPVVIIQSTRGITITFSTPGSESVTLYAQRGSWASVTSYTWTAVATAGSSGSVYIPGSSDSTSYLYCYFISQSNVAIQVSVTLGNWLQCNSSPCVNGATCNNMQDGYRCQCAQGFIGTNCQEKEIKPCDTNPCMNGGSCLETSRTTYACSCLLGYQGQHCQIDNTFQYIAHINIVGGDTAGVLNVILQDMSSGYICADNAWNTNAAMVACRQMGYDNGVARSRPIAANDRVLMHEVHCTGSESNIGLCSYSGWGYTGPKCENIALIFCRREINTVNPTPTPKPTPHQNTTSGSIIPLTDTYDCEDNNPCDPLLEPKVYFYAHTNPGKFVQCNDFGACFVMPCPKGLIWDFRSMVCIAPLDQPANDVVPGSDAASAATYSCEQRNPCKPLIVSGQYRYKAANPQQFIQCGHCEEECFTSWCPPGTFWRSDINMCSFRQDLIVTDTGRYNCLDHNPCKNRTQGYYSHINNHQYIQCGIDDTCNTMTCAPGTEWSQAILTCYVISYDFRDFTTPAPVTSSGSPTTVPGSSTTTKSTTTEASTTTKASTTAAPSTTTTLTVPTTSTTTTQPSTTTKTTTTTQPSTTTKTTTTTGPTTRTEATTEASTTTKASTTAAPSTTTTLTAPTTSTTTTQPSTTTKTTTTTQPSTTTMTTTTTGPTNRTEATTEASTTTKASTTAAPSTTTTLTVPTTSTTTQPSTTTKTTTTTQPSTTTMTTTTTGPTNRTEATTEASTTTKASTTAAPSTTTTLTVPTTSTTTTQPSTTTKTTTTTQPSTTTKTTTTTETTTRTEATTTTTKPTTTTKTTTITTESTTTKASSVISIRDYCDPNPCTGSQSVCESFSNSYLCGCRDGYYGPNCNQLPFYVDPTTDGRVNGPDYNSETEFVRIIVRVPREGATFNLDPDSCTVYVAQRVYPTTVYYSSRYIIVPGSSRTVYFPGSSTTLWYYVTIHITSVVNFLGQRPVGVLVSGAPSLLPASPTGQTSTTVTVGPQGTQAVVVMSTSTYIIEFNATNTVHFYISTTGFPNSTHYQWTTSGSQGQIILQSSSTNRLHYFYFYIVTDVQVSVTFYITMNSTQAAQTEPQVTVAPSTGFDPSRNHCDPNPCKEPHPVCESFTSGNLCGCRDGYYGPGCDQLPSYLDPTTDGRVNGPSYDSETEFVRIIVRVPREGATFNLDPDSCTVYVAQRVYPTTVYYSSRYIIVPGSSRTVYFPGSSTTLWYYVTIHITSVVNFLGQRPVGVLVSGAPSLLPASPTGQTSTTVTVGPQGTQAVVVMSTSTYTIEFNSTNTVHFYISTTGFPNSTHYQWTTSGSQGQIILQSSSTNRLHYFYFYIVTDVQVSVTFHITMNSTQAAQTEPQVTVAPSTGFDPSRNHCDPNPCKEPHPVCESFTSGNLCGCRDGYYGPGCDQLPSYLDPTTDGRVNGPSYDSETEFVRIIVRVPREGATFNLDPDSCIVYSAQRVYPTTVYYSSRYIIVPGSSRTVYFPGGDTTVWYYITIQITQLATFNGQRPIGVLTQGAPAILSSPAESNSPAGVDETLVNITPEGTQGVVVMSTNSYVIKFNSPVTLHIFISTVGFPNSTSYQWTTTGRQGTITLQSSGSGNLHYFYFLFVAEQQVTVNFLLQESDSNLLEVSDPTARTSPSSTVTLPTTQASASGPAGDKTGDCANNPCPAPTTVCASFPAGPQCGCPDGRYGKDCSEPGFFVDPVSGSSVDGPRYTSGMEYVRFIIRVPREGATIDLNCESCHVYIAHKIYPTDISYDAHYSIIPGSSRSLFLAGQNTTFWYFITIRITVTTTVFTPRPVCSVSTGVPPFVATAVFSYATTTIIAQPQGTRAVMLPPSNGFVLQYSSTSEVTIYISKSNFPTTSTYDWKVSGLGGQFTLKEANYQGANYIYFYIVSSSQVSVTMGVLGKGPETSAIRPTKTAVTGNGGYTCSDNSPCSPLAVADRYYYPHVNADMFIQCGTSGQCYQKNCPTGLVWNNGIMNCN